jgi:hypothetical protein
MGFWKDLFSGGSKKEPATKAQVNRASEQISGMVENRDLLQDKAPVQVNSKFSDFLERNRREDGSYNSAAQAIINQYDDGRSNYQVAMEDIKNSPGGKEAFKKAFPNPLVKVAEGVGNYIKGGGILGILPNLISNVNEKVGGIFNNETPATDMGTRMSQMDYESANPQAYNIYGGGRDMGTMDTPTSNAMTEEEAIAASGFPASEFATAGIANPELINASSLLNFEDLLNYNANDVQDIINSFKDNKGFDVQDNQLQYNLNAGPGKFQFGIGPNTAGINFNLPFGA